MPDKITVSCFFKSLNMATLAELEQWFSFFILIASLKLRCFFIFQTKSYVEMISKQIKREVLWLGEGLKILGLHSPHPPKVLSLHALSLLKKKKKIRLSLVLCLSIKFYHWALTIQYLSSYCFICFKKIKYGLRKLKIT